MENVKNFVNKYLDAAKAASNESGIDYRIILTQAGLESAYGQFAFKNNFFEKAPLYSSKPKRHSLKNNFQVPR